jgi:hypothetical protein
MRNTIIVTAASLILAAGVGAWVVTSNFHARLTAPAANPLDPSQMMASAENLPTSKFVD